MTGERILEVRDLRVWYGTVRGAVQAVDGVSFEITRGETLGLVGESGCGKSTLGRGILGLLPAGAAMDGEVVFDGRNLVGLPIAELRHLRGPEIGMIFQEPMTRLNPLMRIEDHFSEVLKVHEPDLTAAQIRKRSLEALGGVGIPPTRFRQYPHEFSGGMRQRIMIALALVLSPKLVVCDEPTTSLDVLVEAQILRDPRRPEAELRYRAPPDHAQPGDHRGGVRSRRRDVRRQDRRGRRRACRLLGAGASVHSRAPPFRHLPPNDRAAVHPRRASGPDGSTARLPVPPSVPRRHAGLYGARSRRPGARLGPSRAVLVARPRRPHPTRRDRAARAGGAGSCRRGMR